jgi:hypothetical protein
MSRSRRSASADESITGEPVGPGSRFGEQDGGVRRATPSRGAASSGQGTILLAETLPPERRQTYDVPGLPEGRGAAAPRGGVDELACRPGSVPAHLAVLRSATIHLGLPLPTASCGLPASSDGPSSNARAGLRRARARRLPSWPCSGWGLPSRSGRPERWWSLTPPFHPYRPVRGGGLFSVALSRGSPRVGVTHHPALRSPDLPRGITPSRPPGQLIRRPVYARRLGNAGGPWHG